jgi:catechol 2,3-dioxygenase-like lactoylglutathione lyase family enzyme
MTNLLDLAPAALADYLAARGEKPFRARQVSRWVHQRFVDDIGAMTDLAKASRAALAVDATVRGPAVVRDSTATDGTRKWLLDAGNGNVLAFFELPTRGRMGRDPNTPAWVQHIAFEVDSIEELHAAKARLAAAGIEVVGPTDHGVFQSIYFFDPNGHRLELAVNTGTPEQLARARSVAPAMLEEWNRTKRAPRHAAWLHDGSSTPATSPSSTTP